MDLRTGQTTIEIGTIVSQRTKQGVVIFAFLTTKIGLPEDSTACALLDFRELRHDDVVFWSTRDEELLAFILATVNAVGDMISKTEACDAIEREWKKP